MVLRAERLTSGVHCVIARDSQAVVGSIAGGYNEGFRAKFRPVHFNLKDEKNPDFRGKVLRGEVQPVDLLRMEPKDMASEVRLHQDLVMNPCCPYLATQTHSPWIVLNSQPAVMQRWPA